MAGLPAGKNFNAAMGIARELRRATIKASRRHEPADNLHGGTQPAPMRRQFI
jgi:hypothetical protein